MFFKHYASLYVSLNEDEWKTSYMYKVKSILKNRLSCFDDVHISDIKATDIKLWLKSITDVGLKTKKGYVSVLRAIFDLALEDELITKSPMVHVKMPSHITPKMNPFTSDEVKMILSEAKKL